MLLKVVILVVLVLAVGSGALFGHGRMQWTIET
jgi:hypothetical protein